MEGGDNEFMFLNQSVSDLLDAFPFNNSFTFQQDNEDFTNFFNFQDIDFFDPLNVHKNLMDGDQLLEKITKCEENYNNIIQHNLIASPTKNVQDKINENFESNLTLAEGTLPGLIISIMHKENSPVTLNFMINEIYPKFEDLRKINGSKYNGDIYKVLTSTLNSSGIFFKTVDDKFYFKEKEALDYIIKVTEKVLTKKLEKQKREMKSIKTEVKASGKTKKKKNQSFSDQMNYKICKVYNILDQMLTRCRGSLGFEKLNNSFKNANSSIELLQKIGDQNKLVGILMCFKYFKSIINKYFKVSSKKKKLESLIDLNKLNEKLDTLSKKMEVLEKSFPSAFTSGNTKLIQSSSLNSIKSTNSNNTNFNSYTSCKSDSIYAVHSESSHTFSNLDL